MVSDRTDATAGAEHTLAGPWLRDRLRGHVEALAEGIGERNLWTPGSLAAAAGYVESTWERQGHTVRRQTWEVDGTPCSNLEIVLGEPAREGVLLVGAHYDTVVGSPGADDNASAVAALLELGRLLGREPLARPLRLVAFANEEAPFFPFGAMGSRVYARRARRHGESIDLMISLEMLGFYDDAPGSQRYPPLLRWLYPDCGNFLAFVANLANLRPLRRTVAAFRASSAFPAESVALPALVPGVSWSDHRSFWKQGYPALMVTDTAFYRNPTYHTAADRPETLDYEALERVTRGLAGMLVRLAGAG